MPSCERFYNDSTGEGTIVALAEDKLSPEDSARETRKRKCPHCLMLSIAKHSICSQMGTKHPTTAFVKSKKKDPTGKRLAKTEILNYPRCSPSERTHPQVIIAKPKIK